MGPTYLTKRESAVEWLRDQILSGALAPGVQLQQVEIAKRLHLSSTPVREAFAQLQAEGLLVARPHRGVLVVESGDVGAIEDVIQIRTFLESKACAKAAANWTAAHAREVHEAIAAARRSMAKADGVGFRQASARFHEAIGAAAGSAVYAEFSKLVIARSLSVLPLYPERMAEVLREHRAIADQLDRHNGAAAARVMRAHLKGNIRPVKESARSRRTLSARSAK